MVDLECSAIQKYLMFNFYPEKTRFKIFFLANLALSKEYYSLTTIFYFHIIFPFSVLKNKSSFAL